MSLTFHTTRHQAATLAGVAAIVLACAVDATAQTGSRPRPRAGTPPPPAAAPEVPPEVVAAAVRVVGPGYGVNRNELRPFNEEPGVALALVIKMPAGSGIVDLDEDDCQLTVFTDDAGTDLSEQADFGSFPKTTADGSAGLIEIESKLRPAAGASGVLAEGVLVFMASPGSKVQKVPNIRLEKGRTFKAGAATVTVDEVTAGTDSTEVGFALPRATLATIREIRFLDAKGEPIESSRTSSGYMNDAASIAYRLTGTPASVTLELDLWQNLKQQKVPFKVKTGLALK